MMMGGPDTMPKKMAGMMGGGAGRGGMMNKDMMAQDMMAMMHGGGQAENPAGAGGGMMGQGMMEQPAMQGMPSRSNDMGTAAASAVDRLTRPGMASRAPMGGMPWGPQGMGLEKVLGMMMR